MYHLYHTPVMIDVVYHLHRITVIADVVYHLYRTPSMIIVIDSVCLTLSGSGLTSYSHHLGNEEQVVESPMKYVYIEHRLVLLFFPRAYNYPF